MSIINKIFITNNNITKNVISVIDKAYSNIDSNDKTNGYNMQEDDSGFKNAGLKAKHESEDTHGDTSSDPGITPSASNVLEYALISQNDVIIIIYEDIINASESKSCVYCVMNMVNTLRALACLEKSNKK